MPRAVPQPGLDPLQPLASREPDPLSLPPVEHGVNSMVRGVFPATLWNPVSVSEKWGTVSVLAHGREEATALGRLCSPQTPGAGQWTGVVRGKEGWGVQEGRGAGEDQTPRCCTPLPCPTVLPILTPSPHPVLHPKAGAMSLPRADGFSSPKREKSGPQLLGPLQTLPALPNTGAATHEHPVRVPPFVTKSP